MSAYGEKSEFVFDDSKRPALPYVAGACFEIKRHKRLTPFDNGQCYEFPAEFGLTEPLLPSDLLPPSKISEPHDNLTPWTWESSPSNPDHVPPRTITERYIKHRPRKTEPYSQDTTTRRLKVIRQIRARDGAYAQVVLCRVDGIRGPLVAKIFDPLYRWDDVEWDEPESPVGLSESEWSCEAAAYERIQEGGLNGIYTPRFEGCWSFDIPWELELERTTTGAVDDITTPGGRHMEEYESENRKGSSLVSEPRTVKLTRNVRLLLMEYIPGDNMLNLLETGVYRDIPPDVRMELLATVAEAKSALWHICVANRDFHARNVVVGRNGENDEANEHYVDDVDCDQEEIHNSSSSPALPDKREETPLKRWACPNPRAGSFQGWHVAIIDFGLSVVRDLANAIINVRGRLPPALPRPQNPITRCRGSWPIYPVCAGEQANWVDQKYDSFEARRKWMETRWGRGTLKGCRYEPIEYDRLDDRRHNEE